MISFDSFANYASALEAKASNANVLVPARYSSMKTLFTIVRDSDNLANYSKKSLSARLNLFGETGQWYYTIGGKNISSHRCRNPRTYLSYPGDSWDIPESRGFLGQILILKAI